MNPVLILIVILIFSNQGKMKGELPQLGKLGSHPAGPAYFDTFKMELLLDKLHSMTNTLEKVNHLNQLQSVPMTKNNSMDRVQESLDVVRGFLSDSKSNRKLDTISNTISTVKRFGDMENIMSTLGPALSFLANNNNEK